MACDCIQKIEEDLVEKQPLEGRNILSAKVNCVYEFGVGTLKKRPVIEVVLSIEGRKSDLKMNISYSYCPFCGASMKDETRKEVTNA